MTVFKKRGRLFKTKIRGKLSFGKGILREGIAPYMAIFGYWNLVIGDY